MQKGLKETASGRYHLIVRYEIPDKKTTENKSGSEVTQSCPTLCDPVDCSLPGSSVHEILQARILEWVAISFSKKLMKATLSRVT